MKIVDIIETNGKKEYVDQDGVIHDMPHPDSLMEKKDILHSWTAKYRQMIRKELKQDISMLTKDTGVDLTAATADQVRAGLLTSAGFKVMNLTAGAYVGYVVGATIFGKLSIALSVYVISDLGTSYFRKRIYYRIFK